MSSADNWPSVESESNLILISLDSKNSQKIILEETTIGDNETNGHFIDHQFDFPPAPKLGIWYAELWYGTNVCEPKPWL